VRSAILAEHGVLLAAEVLHALAQGLIAGLVHTLAAGRPVYVVVDGDIALSTPIAPTAIDRFRSRRSLPIIDALVRYLFL
jgi:hypothetical protein